MKFGKSSAIYLLQIFHSFKVYFNETGKWFLYLMYSRNWSFLVEFYLNHYQHLPCNEIIEEIF